MLQVAPAVANPLPKVITLVLRLAHSSLRLLKAMMPSSKMVGDVIFPTESGNTTPGVLVFNLCDSFVANLIMSREMLMTWCYVNNEILQDRT